MSVPIRKIVGAFFLFGLDRAVDWKMSNPPLWISSSLIGVLAVLGLLIVLDFARQWRRIPLKAQIDWLFDAQTIWGGVFIAFIFATAFVISWGRVLIHHEKTIISRKLRTQILLWRHRVHVTVQNHRSHTFFL